MFFKLVFMIYCVINMNILMLTSLQVCEIILLTKYINTIYLLLFLPNATFAKLV